MRLLVTGASGFVGRRLVTAAKERWSGANVFTCNGPEDTGGVDVTNPVAVRAAVAAACPTHVVNLAAIAAVMDAGRDPRAAFAVNLGGALNLVEALNAEAPGAVLLHVSSAEAYGRSLSEAQGRALDELARLQPINAYAASKAAADLLVQAAAAQGLRAIIARPFNHIGSGQSEAFVVPAFAAQIARAEAGLRPPVIEVGQLEDARDFLAVDDVVDAYLRLLERAPRSGAAEVFNVASGVPVAIGELLARLMRLSPMSLEVRIDPARVRPGPPATYLGDAGRLQRETGWHPRRLIDDVLAEVLSHERKRLVR